MTGANMIHWSITRNHFVCRSAASTCKHICVFRYSSTYNTQHHYI